MQIFVEIVNTTYYNKGKNRGKLENLEREGMTMTLKDKINEVMDLAKIFLNRNDHENYRKCVELIADMVYTTLEAENA